MIDSSGDVVFLGNVTGGTADAGIFRATGGTLSSVALEGQTAIGFWPFVYQAFDRPSMDDQGGVVFSAGGTIGYAMTCALADCPYPVGETSAEIRYALWVERDPERGAVLPERVAL
jgi:hypothetical protein